MVQDEIYYGSQASVDAHDEVTSAAAVARFRTRQDVVRRRGRYGLINENRTPYQAMVEDLMFIRSVLDGAGLDYLLVRGNNHRPVIAVDWKDRKELRDALVEACHDEPFYSMSVDAKKKSSVLVADGELSPNRQSRIFRLYRPRVEPEGGFEFGASAGVQLELWSFEGDQLILPIENSLTRRTLLAQDAVRGTVERYGHTWPTIENMFADHASDISFDVDLVFSWVDGSSPEYIAARRARMAGVVVGEGDDHEARFRQIDELKYALRSVYMFAPWIRRIFIATDSPAPVLAGGSSRGDDCPQRGVLRGPLRAAHPQLAGRGVPAPPHRRPVRALPVLQRRHVLRPRRRTGHVLHARRHHEVHRGGNPDRARGQRRGAQRFRERRPGEPEAALGPLRPDHHPAPGAHGCAAAPQRGGHRWSRSSRRSSPRRRPARSARPTTSR